MKKFMLGYAAGVVTAPAVYFIFRKPLTHYVVTPLSARTIMDEEWDERLFSFMSTRTDWQEFRKKHGKRVYEMKAQGFDNAKIADILGVTEKAVRLLLIAKKPA